MATLIIAEHDKTTREIRKLDQTIQNNKKEADAFRNKAIRLGGEIVAIKQRLVDIGQILRERSSEIAQLKNLLQSKQTEISSVAQEKEVKKQQQQEYLTKSKQYKDIKKQKEQILYNAEKCHRDNERELSQQKQRILNNEIRHSSLVKMLQQHEGVSFPSIDS